VTSGLFCRRTKFNIYMFKETNLKINATPAIEDVKMEILQFCTTPQSKEEILSFIQVELKPYNVRKYITRLVEERYLQFTVGNNPRSHNQQYIISRKGQAYLKALE
jgi:ATP-dependent DNA helicase RecG